MLSLVIPVYNEVESLGQLHEELTAVAGAQGIQFDIVFVDDGSTDGSWKEIERLCQLAGRNLTESEWALFFRELPYRETCE